MNKIYIASNADINIICIADSYKAAVTYLFGMNFINIKDEIMINNEYTTLERFYGEDVIDMMTYTWDIDDFNEFWNGDYWITEYEVFKC